MRLFAVILDQQSPFLTILSCLPFVYVAIVLSRNPQTRFSDGTLRRRIALAVHTMPDR